MKVSLTTKIFLAFSFLLSTFALLAFYSVKEFHDIGEDLRRINEGHLVLARAAGSLETLQQNRFRDLLKSQTEADPAGREVILRVANAYFPEVVRGRVEEVRQLCERQLGSIDPRGRYAERSRAFYREILAHVDRIGSGHAEVDELSEVLHAHVVTTTVAAAAHFTADIERLESTLRGEVSDLNGTITDETQAAVQDAERDERDAIWRVVVMTLIAILVGVLITVLSARSLAPMRALVDFARAISRGDYSREVIATGDDELSQLADELAAMAKNRKEREDELDRQQGELEQAYHRVAELKRYHESVVQSLETAVIVTDRDLVVTSANRAAESRFGLADLRGQSLAALPFARAIGPLEPLLARGAELRLSAIALGELRVDAVVTPFESDQGKVLGLVLAMEDVTEGVRTKEALIRSERLAAIGRMSAHVTHEVRNPLASIGLNAELLEALISESGAAGPQADEAHTLARAIGREVDRLTAITEEYLRFARLPRPELASEDVGALLGSIAQFVRRDLENAKVSLVFALAPDLRPVELDRDQIRQAVLNLVRNAKESMPEGGVVELGAEIEGDRVAIVVRDHGVGIAPENVERIFDPFFSTKLTGTGLGLALCHQIVVEHGGELAVRSEVGKGSEFRLLLGGIRGSVARDAVIEVFPADDVVGGASPRFKRSK